MLKNIKDQTKQSAIGAMSKQAVTYQLLKEALIHQDFEPGSVLSERELCSYFGVSRPPVHNAVVQLVADGMLKMAHEKKIIVPPTTPSDLHEIYEMLEYLQIASLQSHEKFSMDSFRFINSTLKQMEESINDPSLTIYERFLLDNKFHSLLLQDVSNTRLKESFEKYSNQYSLYSSIMFRYGNWRDNELKTHQNIFDALKNGMFSDFINAIHTHYEDGFSHYVLWTAS